MDEERTRAIADFIEQCSALHDTIAGSAIGLSLKDRFPDLNIKTEYGGLRRFIQLNLSETVKFIEKKGGDNIFRHISKGTDQLREVQGPPSLSAPDLPWKAFVGPHGQHQLAVDALTGSLSTCRIADQPPEGTVAVPKLTGDEHRSIAKDFLPSLPSESRPTFERALRETNYWQSWNLALKDHPDVFKEWLRWRREQILRMFGEKLQLLGVPADASMNAINAMGSLKPALTEKPADTDINRDLRAKDPVPPTKPAGRTLHDLAHAAIDALQEDELRRVWLPLGAVADALRRG
jgi:hypothetical protein